MKFYIFDSKFCKVSSHFVKERGWGALRRSLSLLVDNLTVNEIAFSEPTQHDLSDVVQKIL